MQDELVLKIKALLIIFLLELTSCAMGGDVHRRYVISHASDDIPQEQSDDFK